MSVLSCAQLKNAPEHRCQRSKRSHATLLRGGYENVSNGMIEKNVATPHPSRSEASSVMKFYFCILLGSHFCLREIVFRSFLKDFPNVNMNVSPSALIYHAFVKQTSRLAKKKKTCPWIPPRFAGMRVLGWSFGDRRHGHPRTSNSKFSCSWTRSAEKNRSRGSEGQLVMKSLRVNGSKGEHYLQKKTIEASRNAIRR